MTSQPLPPDESEPEPSPLRPLSDFISLLTPFEALTLDAETDRIIERRARVQKLRAQRHTIAHIAKELGCSPGTVHSDITALRAGCLRITAQHMREHQAQMLDDLEVRLREAWAAWERSKSQMTETTTTRGAGGGKSKSVTRRFPVGDPRWLSAIRACWHDLGLLTGALSPEDVELAEMLAEIERIRALLRGKDGASTTQKESATLEGCAGTTASAGGGSGAIGRG